MKTWFGLLVASLIMVFVLSYAWTHRHHVAIAVAVQPTPQLQTPQSEVGYAEAKDAQKTVTVAGPLADYMLNQKPTDVETLQHVPYKPVATDYVKDSPVGTSNPILHQTFSVRNAVDLPFEVPAHAANPQFRGTYRSFTQQRGSAQSSDSTADVEFFLFNEQQYNDFLGGHAGEAVISADSAHYQEVNTGLPPTLDHPVKYYIVFRNSSRSEGKKIVQADFRIDF